jgi:hypothetical protein
VDPTAGLDTDVREKILFAFTGDRTSIAWLSRTTIRDQLLPSFIGLSYFRHIKPGQLVVIIHVIVINHLFEKQHLLPGVRNRNLKDGLLNSDFS